MSERTTPSARFSILFMLTLAAISGTVYVVFSKYQYAMTLRRRRESTQNLSDIGGALRAYAAKHGGRFPDRSTQLTREFLPYPRILIHAAWPDQPGYIYIPGATAADAPSSTILVHENVPERKRKLGIQVLWLSREIGELNEADFMATLNAQEEAWKKSGRIWSPGVMVPDQVP